MPRYANIFQPQTEIGQGLNNAIMSLFSGSTPNERADREALAQLRMSQIGTEGEQQRLFRAKADEQESLNRGRANFRTNALAPPGVSLEDALSFLDTGAPPSRTRVAPMGGGSGEIPAPEFTPGAQRHIRAVSTLDPLLQAGGGNAQQLAEALDTLFQSRERQEVLAGDLDSTRFFQSRGKPTRTIDEGYDVNVADPSIPPTEMGIATALIGQREAAADKYRRQQPSKGISLRIDENGNPVLEIGGAGGGLTKPNQTAVQKSAIDNSMTMDIIQQARLVAGDPRNFGLSGKLRETVQDAIQQGDALAQTLGGAARGVQEEILGMGSDVGLENFDPNIPKLDMLINVLAFRMAKMNDPGGRVTDRDFTIARSQIGGRGMLANQREFLSRIDLFEQMLNKQQERNAGYLGARPSGTKPAKAAPALVPQGGPVQIKSDADYDRLPSGTEFIAPDGTKRRKP